MSSRPAARGTWLAISAALAFGITTPAVQRFGRGAGPFATAALLYAGAALVALVTRAKRTREAPLTRAHVPRLVAIAALGAFVAPVALAWGLARTSGVGASLMLNFEAVFTVLFARALYKEHVGGRVAVAMLVLVGAGGVLAWRGAQSGDAGIGLAGVAVATLAWAADNAVAKPLAQIDPGAVVLGKASIGAALSACIAIATKDAWPAARSAIAIGVCGATGYGLSLRLYFMAQRRLGAGRTGSIFATGPFFGAAIAWMLGEPFGGAWELAAAAAMVIGVALHLTEEHEHAHVHDAVEHEHAHRHDDGHHDHVHDVMPDGEHSHAHRHDRVAHSHPHVPDTHHEHRH